MKKQIKGFKNYFITENGEVTNKKGEKMRPQVNADGYLVINLRSEKKEYHRRINRLVAETYIPNPDNLPVVNHKDHDRQNNHISNLEWCTVEYNTKESVRLFPERWKSQAVVDASTVEIICRMIQDYKRNKEISEKLNVGIDLIKHIRAGRSWKEISCNYNMTKSIRSVSPETVKWVCYRIKEGLKNKEILNLSTSKGLTNSIVKRIRSGKIWKEISKDII